MLECPPDTFEYIPLFVRLRTSKKIGFSEIIPIFASEINNNTIMKCYTYTTTRDFTTGYEWIAFYRNYFNVSFSFRFDTYKESFKTAWLSPEKAYHFLLSHQFTVYDFTITMRIQTV